MCSILRLAPCSVATARAVLLSALACIRIDSPISFRIACAKINSAHSAPRAYNFDSPLPKQLKLQEESPTGAKMVKDRLWSSSRTLFGASSNMEFPTPFWMQAALALEASFLRAVHCVVILSHAASQTRKFFAARGSCLLLWSSFYWQLLLPFHYHSSFSQGWNTSFAQLRLQKKEFRLILPIPAPRMAQLAQSVLTNRGTSPSELFGAPTSQSKAIKTYIYNHICIYIEQMITVQQQLFCQIFQILHNFTTKPRNRVFFHRLLELLDRTMNMVCTSTSTSATPTCGPASFQQKQNKCHSVVDPLALHNPSIGPYLQSDHCPWPSLPLHCNSISRHIQSLLFHPFQFPSS